MTEPSKKSKGIEEMIEGFAQSEFGRGRKESIEQDICVTCGKEATEFKDNLSRKEFSISGMCQICQDGIFG